MLMLLALAMGTVSDDVSTALRASPRIRKTSSVLETLIQYFSTCYYSYRYFKIGIIQNVEDGTEHYRLQDQDTRL
jgi:hypothetical protein